MKELEAFLIKNKIKKLDFQINKIQNELGDSTLFSQIKKLIFELQTKSEQSNFSFDEVVTSYI